MDMVIVKDAKDESVGRPSLLAAPGRGGHGNSQEDDGDCFCREGCGRKEKKKVR